MDSLILTKNFGNVPMLAAHFQEEAKRRPITSTIETAASQSRLSHDMAPQRWRFIEWHCAYRTCRPVETVANIHHHQGCLRWSCPCCVSQPRSSCTFGCKRELPQRSQFPWLAYFRCFRYFISYRCVGSMCETKGSSTSRMLAIGITVLASLYSPFPYLTLPQSILHVLHLRVAIDIARLRYHRLLSIISHWHSSVASYLLTM
jgi:hypothetical protein